MESLAFSRRPGPAPSTATALAAELARPLGDGLIKSPKPLMKKQAVKRHHHKHNLRHRYEFLETLGKGTYGKVKKARESSGRLVSGYTARAGRGMGHGPGAHRSLRAARLCTTERWHGVETRRVSPVDVAKIIGTAALRTPSNTRPQVLRENTV